MLARPWGSTGCPCTAAAQGPAHPARAGGRRRHGRAGRLVLRAGAGLAHAALPAAAARAPGPAWLQRLVDDERFQWTRARSSALLFAGYLTWALIWGPDLVTNPVLGTFYVLVWVGMVPGLAAVRPRRQGGQPGAHAQPAAGQGHRRRPGRRAWSTYPARLGYWPAALGLLAFVWQELVNPQSAYLGSVRIWLAAYLAVMLVGAAVFGDEWFERADPFEVYSSLLAKLSPWGRDRRPARRTQPAGQPRTTVTRARAWWPWSRCCSARRRSTATRTRSRGSASSSTSGLNEIFTNTVALLVFCLVVGVHVHGRRDVDGRGDDRARTPYAAARCRTCWRTR